MTSRVNQRHRDEIANAPTLPSHRAPAESGPCRQPHGGVQQFDRVPAPTPDLVEMVAAAEPSPSEVELEQFDCILVGSVATSGQLMVDTAHQEELEAP